MEESKNLRRQVNNEEEEAERLRENFTKAESEHCKVRENFAEAESEHCKQADAMMEESAELRAVLLRAEEENREWQSCDADLHDHLQKKFQRFMGTGEALA